MIDAVFTLRITHSACHADEQAADEKQCALLTAITLSLIFLRVA